MFAIFIYLVYPTFNEKSMSNSVIKYLKSLSQSKYRQMYNNFVVEGNKMLDMILNQNEFEIECIAYRKSNIEIEDKLQSLGCSIYAFDNKQMSQISLLKSPSDVFIVLKKQEFKLSTHANKIFYLDGIQDPGNVGTIVRIADWFGIDTLIRNQETADFYHPKVIQASMGSFLNVKLINDDENIDFSTTYNIYGADMTGVEIENVTFEEKSMIVLGSEGHGISKKMNQVIQTFISIKGSKKRMAESLNVANAAAIIAYKMSN